MNRRNLILTITLIAQAFLILLIVTLQPPGASANASPLLGETQSADIARLAIQDKNNARIEIARAGEGWALPQFDDFPADAGRINPFLEKLIGIRTGRLIARTAASHERLQVSPSNYVRRVELTLSNGNKQTLFIGSSAGGSAVHVRLDGADEVYLANGLSSFDAGIEASSWIDTAYLQVAQDQVNNIILANANGQFEFEKDADGAWKMKGLSADEKLDAAKVTELLSRLSFVSMTRPLGKTLKAEYGLQPPTATITVTLKQENASPRPITLRIGAQDTATSAYIVQSSESPYFVQVSSFTVEPFIQRTRQDFLIPPPTPTISVEESATPAPTSAP